MQFEDYVYTYLNRREVKGAIHAGNIKWDECGGPPYTFGHDSMIPLYRTFMINTNWKLLVYSGDADTVLNFISTEQWVQSLKLTVKSAWKDWTYVDPVNGPQVGGWWITYDRLTFKTVKGAGHMVPWYQPVPSLKLITDFIKS